MADVALLRKRIKSEMEQARRTAAERRDRARVATRAYEAFLDEIAIPAFRQVVTVLRAEGLSFEVQTPSAGVRMTSDRNRDDGIQLELDSTLDPPQPILISTRTWGSRIVRNERVVKDRAAIETITEEDLIDRLLEELRPWLG